MVSSVRITVLVAVDEIFDHVGVIYMNPSVGVMPGMIFQVQGVDPGVFDPLRGSVILVVRLGGKRKGVEVRSGTSEFHSGDC